MSYKSMYDCVQDLENKGHLIRIRGQVDPNLEMAEIQRQVFEANGPALFFESVKGSPFPAVSNLFGTIERARFIFRKTLPGVKQLIQAKADPAELFKKPLSLPALPFRALKALPSRAFSAPVMAHQTTIDQLPAIKSWPKDGGPFITLPQVYSEDPAKPGILQSNLGMYRIQLSGNKYAENQIGLHYQIHRGIGVHHARALEKKEALRVSIFVGGPPAHTFAAVMPLPEGLSELAFAGALAGRRFRYKRRPEGVISTEADFCITGVIENESLPEGPFGDHLGYYSLKHNFPVMRVDNVYHRKNAVWPFTAVGRPPQEDTIFGKLIHEMTGPMVPVSIPGLREMHAVDAAGVHPLLLAVGSERYVPYAKKRRPMELMTIANAILGFNQASLAKYLFIIAGEDNPQISTGNLPVFLKHLLERADFTQDLHFQTRTTIDTLDYSGGELNRGSKLVITAAGEKRFPLTDRIPAKLKLPTGFKDPRLALPGILVVQGKGAASTLAKGLSRAAANLRGVRIIALVDDSEFTARTLNNFLWVVFTRSNPATDIAGVGEFTEDKHWGCTGPLIIDARVKKHHAPPLIEDPRVAAAVREMGAEGGELHGIL